MSVMRRLFTPLSEPRTWTVTLYLILTCITGTFWITALTSLVAVGLGFLFLWVGALVLAVLPVMWRYGARAERALIGTLVGVHIQSPYRPLPHGTVFARARALVSDRAAWKDLAYLLLLFPLGVCWSSLTLAFWGWGLSLLALPLYFGLLPDGRILWLGLDRLMPAVRTLPEALLAALAGAALVIAAPHVVRGLAYLHQLFATAMLGASQAQQLASETARLRVSRDRVLEAVAAERRRLERDLHDGAQQRLVSVALGVGLTRQKVHSDPDAADKLLEDVQTEVTQAIAELRDLARGLNPVMLAEQGLDAALSALAGRSPVSVDIAVDLRTRPPQRVEEAAYFTVAEALTNAAKHADPNRAWVTITRRGAMLDIIVGDDGVGGATQVPGGGLAGLADRVAGQEGTMELTSPHGGPTVITVELPCES